MHPTKIVCSFDGFPKKKLHIGLVDTKSFIEARQPEAYSLIVGLHLSSRWWQP